MTHGVITHSAGRAPKGCTVFAEGKTKYIWRKLGEKKFGMAQNKPFVTAGDGKHREFVPGKEVAVTETACNIFTLLERRGIPTHFQSKVNEDTYLIRLLKMAPIEVVVRRVMYGSYLQRNPHAKEGEIFAQPLVEFFYKNDKMSDPMMIWHPKHQCYRLYHPHELPEMRGHIGELNATDDPLIPHSEKEAEQLEVIAIETFLALEDAFQRVGVTLVDFKSECGYDENKKAYVGDQIDGDSCRLWINGDKNKAVDKDRYRKIVNHGRVPTPEERAMIVEDYRRIAQMTSTFAVL